MSGGGVIDAGGDRAPVHGGTDSSGVVVEVGDAGAGVSGSSKLWASPVISR